MPNGLPVIFSIAQAENQNLKELRLDIQALRGLAVLLVVAYHAGLPFFPAGYLGVDVFFVISGYLITGLIKDAIERKDFSFIEFYYRRTKRLVPAAYVVIFSTIALAPFFISEVAFQELKVQVWGAITFTANIALWQQSGYFDTEAETKPLLHFWSLAIEEQYYLAMPAVLFFTPRRLWRPLIALGCAGSAAICFWLVQHNQPAVFYLLPTRAWELALGALLAMTPVHQIPTLLHWARLPAIAVIIGVSAFSTGFPHPSLDAAFVTLATVVIVARKSGSRVENSAPVRAFAFFGDFSYSLYLVHWPVIVFTRAAWLEYPPAWALAIAVLFSIAAAYLLFRYVEQPFHRGFEQAQISALPLTLATTCLLAVSPTILSRLTSDGTDYTFVRRTNYGIDRACAFGAKYPFTGVLPDKCRSKPNAKVLIWGDSYAMAWAAALEQPFEHVGLEQATMSSCAPLLNMAGFPIVAKGIYDKARAKKCIDLHRDILRYVLKSDAVEIVVLSARFGSLDNPNLRMLVRRETEYVEEEASNELAAQGLSEMTKAVRASNKKVVILAPPPADGSNIGECLERQAKHKITFAGNKDCSLNMHDVRAERRVTWSMLKRASELSGTPVLFVEDFLCKVSTCPTSIDGTFLYRDSGHLSVEGARLIGDRFNIGQRLVNLAK